MIHNFANTPSVIHQYLFELRNVDIQKDGLRFRRNLERMGELMAYEISKTLEYVETEVETPFGTAKVKVPEQNMVVAAILRAGLPLHRGIINVMDYADSAFVSTYRKHNPDGSFQVKLEYVTCPDLTDSVLVIADPMLATGSTVCEAVESLLEYGQPRQIHLVTAISSNQGIEHVSRLYPQMHIWTGDVDEELTAKSYIVPGLGDAGDLCFGKKQID
jgi:uracil phosphoribosyltransferase